MSGQDVNSPGSANCQFAVLAPADIDEEVPVDRQSINCPAHHLQAFYQHKTYSSLSQVLISSSR